MTAQRAPGCSPLALLAGLAVASALAGCPGAGSSATGISLTPVAQLAEGGARLQVRVPLGDPPDRHVQTLAANSTEAVVYFDSATARVAPSTMTIPRASFTTVPGGVVTTIAGTGAPGITGDGGAATSAKLANCHGIASDAAGNLYLAVEGAHVVRRIDAVTGVITRIAGTGTAGFSGDGGAATAAKLNLPSGIAVDLTGNVYIADNGNGRVRKVDATTGVITTITGLGGGVESGDGGPAVAADFIDVGGICVDRAGNVFVSEYDGHRVRRIDATTGVIKTIAGNGGAGYTGDGGPATSAELFYPDGLAVDPSGRRLYIAEESNHVVRQVNLVTGTISTLAGTGVAGYSGDGGPATAAQLDDSHGLDVDGAGNVYVVDASRNVVRRVDAATGVITTVAGTGAAGYGGDGGAATSALFDGPTDVSVDTSGNLYITDEGNYRVRRVSGGYMEFVASGATTPAMPVLRPATDYVANVDLRTAGAPASLEAFGFSAANTLQAGANALTLSIMNNLNVSLFAGEPTLRDATGAQAFFNEPQAVALDSTGANLYVADYRNNAIRKVVVGTGVTTTLAGNGQQGGTNGTGLSARFDTPMGLVVNTGGTALFVADSGNSLIRKVTLPGGVVTAFAGGGNSTGSYLDGTGGATEFNSPRAMVCDSADTLYVADTSNHCIRKITSAGVVSLVAGTTVSNGFGGLDGQPGFTDGVGAAAAFSSPQGLTLDEANGVLYVADTGNAAIRKIDLATATVSTFVSSGFRSPVSITYDGADLWVSDPSAGSGDRIRKVVVATQAVSTAAGASPNGHVDATGLSAHFNDIAGLVTLPGGGADLFVADSHNHAIRRMVRATGDVTTLAGGLAPGATDGAIGTARFRGVDGMCLNAAGTKLYMAEPGNARVRMIDLTTGLVSTLAGSGVYGCNDAVGAAAMFKTPIDVALNPAETVLYVSDYDNFRLRAIDLATNTVTTLAGSGYGHVDATGTSARFQGIEGIWADAAGDIYVVERYGNTVRKVTPAGVVTTIAGTGVAGSTNGPAASAKFDDLYGITGDGFGNLYLGEYGPGMVRKLNLPTMTVSTLAGTGVYGFADGPGASARFSSIARLACDAGGNVFVADKAGNRIRKIARDGYVTTVAGGTLGYANGFRDVARYAAPWGLAVDKKGVVYTSEIDSRVIRRIQ